MNLNEENSIRNIEENDTLNIREEIEKYLSHWKWFALGVVLSLFVAYVYLRYATPQYSATSLIMIKDNQKSSLSTELEAFEDLGIIGGGGNNPDNEIEILKSRKIIGNAIDTLDLNTSYFIEGIIKRVELYKESPIKIHYTSKSPLFEDTSIFYTVSIISEDTFELKDDIENVLTSHSFGEEITSELGVFKIVKTKYFDVNKYTDVFVTVTRKPSILSSYGSRLNIDFLNKNTSVLSLSLNDPVEQKAIDFLDELVRQYNLDAISDKSEVSKKTKDFIDERLNEIGKDLALIQDNVKDYRTKNKITGMSKEGELALENASRNNQEIIGIRTELNLAKWIQESIEQQSKDESLPQNLGFTDANISQSITLYNELVSKKNRLSINAGDKNPLLLQYQSEITILKNNIKKSISNLIYSLESKLNQLNREASKVNARVSSIPLLERGFIDIAREQEIISGLYSYLLTKKEETAISLAVTVANAKIIDVAYGSDFPVSPKRKIIYLAALLIGLLIPFIIIYSKHLLDTKIHSRKDIEDLTNIPFLGDVPHSENEEKIVIKSDSRSSSAEAFRLIRTSLDFILSGSGSSNKGSAKTIFVTSTTSGEGKSFISINLAAALTLSSKRVLLMSMDLRLPKVAKYLGIDKKRGVTNFITNESLSLDDIIYSTPEVKGLDVITVGAIPPNPAELLLTDKVKELFDIVKKEYDYIIVDTAPVGLVTDTLLISKYADMCMFVARANYLDKRMLAIPQNLYKEKKLPNMAIVLNDIDMSRSYGYGGYGYSYGYTEKEKKSWSKNIFSSK